MKQTAVEWLVEEMQNFYFVNFKKTFLEEIEVAKEMEKQQIIDTYETSHISMMTAKQYYNETFKKK